MCYFYCKSALSLSSNENINFLLFRTQKFPYWDTTSMQSVTLHGTRYTQQPETHVATTLQSF
jgi:hypothetical protein